MEIATGDESNILLVVTDGELEMAGDNTLLLVVACSVSSELEDLSGEVLEDSGEVDCSGGARVSFKSPYRAN